MKLQCSKLNKTRHTSSERVADASTLWLPHYLAQESSHPSHVPPPEGRLSKCDMIEGGE